MPHTLMGRSVGRLMRSDFDLLIIGGGLVGACLAGLAASDRELSRLKIALLEAHPPTQPPEDASVDLRVSAISRASQRILDACGAWSRLSGQHLSAYTEMVVWDATGRPAGAGSLRFSAAESGEPDLGHIVENRRLQWSLYDSPAFRARVTVLRAELAALSLGDGQTTVTLADGRTITATLVVGADGAASTSRKLAGIETGGWDYEQHAFVTHLKTAHPHERTAWQRFLPAGPLAFLPLADGRSSIVWTTTPEHAAQLVDGDAVAVAAQISAAIDGVFGEIEIAAPRAKFPLRLSFARDYCKPGFVLVGDAAHSVHPLAGQGVNLGFMDCAALVQTLSQELESGGRAESIAEHRVLRRYERWRKSENTIALGLIDGINRLFSNSSDSLTWLRRTGLSGVNRSAFARRMLMGRAMGVTGELADSARPSR